MPFVFLTCFHRAVRSQSQLLQAEIVVKRREAWKTRDEAEFRKIRRSWSDFIVSALQVFNFLVILRKHGRHNVRDLSCIAHEVDSEARK